MNFLWNLQFLMFTNLSKVNPRNHFQLYGNTEMILVHMYNSACAAVWSRVTISKHHPLLHFKVSTSFTQYTLSNKLILSLYLFRSPPVCKYRIIRSQVISWALIGREYLISCKHSCEAARYCHHDIIYHNIF